MARWFACNVFHAPLQRGQRFLLAGEIGRFLTQLLLDVAHDVGRRSGDRRQFLVEPGPSLIELLQRLRGAVAARLGDARFLLGQRDPLLQLRERSTRGGDLGIERRQRRVRRLLFQRCLFARGERRRQCGIGGDAIGGKRRFLPGQRAQAPPSAARPAA